MKKATGVILLGIGLFFVGVAFFVKSAVFQESGKIQTFPPAIATRALQMKNPPFNFTFEYPEAWQAAERSYAGEYDMVEVMGVTDKNPLAVPGIFITKKPLRANDDASSLMKSWLGEEGRYQDFRASSPQDFEVNGQKGLKVDYSYKISLPIGTIGASKVTMKKTQIIVVKGNFSYHITFMGTEAQFTTYQAVFSHCLETFKFLD